MQQLSNFIDGEYRAPVGGGALDNVNPATGEVYCLCPDSDERDVALAVEAARSAFVDWSRWPTARRAEVLRAIARGIEDRLDDFAHAESRDQGKPVSLAKAVDIPRAVKNFRYFAGLIEHSPSSCQVSEGGFLNYSHWKPVGVAGLISPWNLPLYLLTWKLAPALAAGNTIVAKPSELTPYTAWMLGDVLRGSGLPAGVCNIVLGTGARAGAALTGHPHVPLISFTGGTKTAEHISRNAAPHFKKLSLELGGKNPNIIFDDADLDACVSTTVKSSFANQGEICLCGSRIFVQEGIFEAFMQRFVAQVKDLNVGDPESEDTDLGALVSADHCDKVMGYIAQARQLGGKIHVGGARVQLTGRCAGGYFVAPTVVSGLDPRCLVMQEEIFGPVVTVTPFRDEAHALGLANDVRYGLSASVWTRDLERAHRMAQSLEAGIVWVNCWLVRDLSTPFGGVKASGVGREGGTYSLRFFSEVTNICINLSTEERT